MKKIWLALAIAIPLLALPLTAMAADFRGDSNSLNIGANETVDHNLYVGSSTVIVDGKVNGDLFALGSQVTVNGEIKNDLFVAGGQVSVKGKIDGDLRVIGGNIELDGIVNGQLLAVGSTVIIDKNAVVAGDVDLKGGQITINGSTGQVAASVTSLTVGDSAKIEGNLVYTSESVASISNSAIFHGEVTHKLPQKAKSSGIGTVASGGIFSFILTLLVGLVFLLIFPNKSTDLANDFKVKFGQNFVWGLVSLVLAPIAIIILLITIVGIPFAIGLGLLYPILLYLGHIVSVIAVGSWLKNYWEKHDKLTATWLAVIVGAIALSVLMLIPILGWIVCFVIFLVGFGALIKFDWNLFTDLKNKKTL